jgi:hypothetical protein
VLDVYTIFTNPIHEEPIVRKLVALLTLAVAVSCSSELTAPEPGEVSRCQRTTKSVVYYTMPGDDRAYALELASCVYPSSPPPGVKPNDLADSLRVTLVFSPGELAR